MPIEMLIHHRHVIYHTSRRTQNITASHVGLSLPLYHSNIPRQQWLQPRIQILRRLHFPLNNSGCRAALIGIRVVLSPETFDRSPDCAAEPISFKSMSSIALLPRISFMFFILGSGFSNVLKMEHSDSSSVKAFSMANFPSHASKEQSILDITTSSACSSTERVL
jgi:hypothetical protein